MIQPIYRILEVCLYSLLNFLPFLALALYPFRDNLRFSGQKTALLIAALTCIQVFVGLYAAFFPGSAAGILSLVSTASYAVFYFTAIKKHPGQLLFTLLMLSNIANFTVIASKCLEGLFFPDLALQQYRYSMSLFILLVETAIAFPVFHFIKNVYTPAMSAHTLGHDWNYLWLIPTTFYLIWYYVIYGNSTLTSLEIALIPKNAIILLFINAGAILVYYIVSKLILDQNKILNLQQQNHQLQLQTLQYEKLQTRINDARRAAHDMHHHIAIIQDYLNTHNYSGLELYLNQYKKKMPDNTPISFCENSAANVVLHYYAQEAKQYNFTYSAYVNIPENCGIDSSDLVVLLGNLLENALDACRACTDPQKQIIIRATNDVHSLCITVDNSFANKIRKSPDDNFFSSKHTGIGLGTLSVKTIVSKYNGVCHFEWNDNTFYSSAIFFKNLTTKP